MQLHALTVMHSKKVGAVSLPTSIKLGSLFTIETCQRTLWIGRTDRLKESVSILDENIEIYQGTAAYLFLLRVACGLESEVVGETDVFGQIKQAWRQFELSDEGFTLELSGWMQRLFEDTKEIRSRYLQNLGGHSYGTLVRKLVKEERVSSDRPLLIVGAGRIAQSIAPLLLEFPILLWNRDPHRLCNFYEELSSRGHSSVKKVGLTSESDAWKTASHCIVCIPLDQQKDFERINWFKSGGTNNRSVIHLGGMTEQCQNWKDIPEFYCLSDLFALQSSMNSIRSVHVSQAEKACTDRARLRSMGGSLSIPHGWEDLACFA